MIKSLINFFQGGSKPPVQANNHLVGYISKLQPGKYRLPDTPETREAQVVYIQSEVPHPEWLRRYRQSRAQ